MALASCFALTTLGCAPINAPDPPNEALARQRFAFRDGGETHYFEFVRALTPTPSEAESWIFVFPGSGCASIGSHLPSYFRGLEGESGPLRVFVLEKRHSNPKSDAQPCTDRFVRDDHPRRWLSDYNEFVAAQLARRQPLRVVLVGISESGEVVPRLASEIAHVTHVVLLASPGADPLDAFRRQAAKYRMAGADEVLAVLSGPPPTDVDGTMVAGRSYRYWAELAELATRASLLQLRIPILIGIGEADRMVPAELAFETRDLLASSGRASLTLLAFANADHGLVDVSNGRRRLPDFWHNVDLWLAR